MIKKKRVCFRYVTAFIICISILAAGAVPDSAEAAGLFKKPGRVKIISVSSKKVSKATVKWKKRKCSRYQIQAATDRSFSRNCRQVTVKSSKNIATIKKLKKGTKYFFRIRAYNRKVFFVKYGKWSKIKTCTVHKHEFLLKKWNLKGKYYKCSCGKKLSKKNVLNAGAVHLMNAPNICEPSLLPLTSSKSKNVVDVTSRNRRGFTYNYRLYYQRASALNKSSKYMYMHGCSTCALTTVLRATVPKLSEYTPNQIKTKVIKKVAGSKIYKANFSKKIDKQSPISLYGISMILTEYGVKHKYVSSYTKAGAKAELKKHLSNGDPVIFFSKGKLYTKNGYAHAMLMLGLDKNGNAIFGDSMKQKGLWGAGNYGLLKYGQAKKPNSNSLKNVVKYLKAPADYKTTGFFNGKLGYILINNQD